MNPERALVKLQTIEEKYKKTQYMLKERLPMQRALMLANLYAVTWLGKCDKLAEKYCKDDLLKRIRLELSAHNYTVLEQGEILTRLLCELDGILSEGNEEIKHLRKEKVVMINQLLNDADMWKAKTMRLKEHGENMIQPFIEKLEQKAKQAVDDQTETMTSDNIDDPMDAVESEHVEDPKHAVVEEEETTNLRSIVDNKSEHEDMESSDSDDSDDDEESDESGDENDTEAENKRNTNNMETEDAEVASNCQQVKKRQETNSADNESPKKKVTSPTALNAMARLPFWKPRYQIFERQDGVYFQINLRGVDPNNFKVEAVGPVLRVSGYKLPDTRDIQLSRFTGVPTFGRFLIEEPLPRDVLDLDSASYQLLSNGTLEVRIPRHFIPVPKHSYSFGRPFPYGLVW